MTGHFGALQPSSMDVHEEGIQHFDLVDSGARLSRYLLSLHIVYIVVGSTPLHLLFLFYIVGHI